VPCLLTLTLQFRTFENLVGDYWVAPSFLDKITVIQLNSAPEYSAWTSFWLHSSTSNRHNTDETSLPSLSAPLGLPALLTILLATCLAPTLA
jgi:hypothetical protein